MKRLSWRIGTFLAICIGAMLTACGGGGDPAPPAKTPTALSISVGQGYLPTGESRQFSASTKYSDGSVGDVTSVVTWSSSDPSVASVSTTGIAKAGFSGSTVITATWSGLTATSQLVVDGPLVRIWFAALTTAVAPGATLRIAAWGHYADQEEPEISNLVTWRSLDTGIATMVAGQGGTVLGVKPGTAKIEASLDGVTAVIDVHVLPITELAHGVTIGYGAASIDPMGRIDVAAFSPMSGPVSGTPAFLEAWHGDTTGWQPKVNATAGIDDRVNLVALAAGGSPAVSLLAWSGQNGLYATRRVGAAPWQPARVLASGFISGSQTFATSLNMTVDHLGNGLLTWIGDGGIHYMTCTAGSDAWGPDQLIPNAGFGLDMKMVGNPAGQRVLVWRQFIGPPPAPVAGEPIQWRLWAILYSPQSGWSTPVTILSGTTGLTGYDVSINAAGQILVGGSVFYSRTLAEEPTVFAARYLPGSGWQPMDRLASGPQTQPTGDGIQFTYAGTALDDNGNGLMVWASAYDSSIWARRLESATGWSPANEMISAGAGGSPVKVWAFATQDGRLLATWLTGSHAAGYRSWTSTSGWKSEGRFPSISHKGPVAGNSLSFSFNGDGKGVAVWTEYYDVFLPGQIRGSATDVFSDTTLSF